MGSSLPKASILPPQYFTLWQCPSSPAALGSHLQTSPPTPFPDCLRMPQLCCAAGGVCLARPSPPHRSGEDKLLYLPLFWHLRAVTPWGRMREVSTQVHTFALGNGSESVSWVLKIKEKSTNKPGQMEALVTDEDTGDGDKHEGLSGRSWGCGEPMAPAGSISVHCSHWASPRGGCGDETRLA